MSKSTDNMKKDKDLGDASSSAATPKPTAATPKSTLASADLKSRFENLKLDEDTKAEVEQMDKRSKSEKEKAELYTFFSNINEQTLQNLEHAASRNDKIAQYKLGMYYHYLVEQTKPSFIIGDPNSGEKGPLINFFKGNKPQINKQETMQKAVTWLGLAAKQDVPQAIFILASFLTKDMNRLDAVQQAYHFEKKAADLGHDGSQFNMAQAYRNGLTVKSTVVVEKNPQKAFEYYLKSAKQGLIYAQQNLAICYVRGFGTPKNNKEALFWLTTAFGAQEAESKLRTMIAEHSNTATVEEITTPSTASAASSASSTITVSTVASSTKKHRKK